MFFGSARGTYVPVRLSFERLESGSALGETLLEVALRRTAATRSEWITRVTASTPSSIAAVSFCLAVPVFRPRRSSF